MFNLAATTIAATPKSCFENFLSDEVSIDDINLYVYETSIADTYIPIAVLPFELSVFKDCYCLDFNAYWMLRNSGKYHRWVIWNDDPKIPQYLNEEAVALELASNPPICFTDREEILGVKVERLA